MAPQAAAQQCDEEQHAVAEAPRSCERRVVPQTGSRREKLYLELGPNCHYCQCEVLPLQATLDHVVPRIFGGPNTLWNMVLSCRPCNNRKGVKVGICECTRCTRALNRFCMTRTLRPQDRTPRAGKDKRKTRTLDQAMKEITARINQARHSLDTAHAADPVVAASLRGTAHGLQTALNLLRTVDDDAPSPQETPTAQWRRLGVDPEMAQRMQRWEEGA